jgi:hypothetical protein
VILRDSYGWPVELVAGRPVLNILRRLLVTSWRETWNHRHHSWPPPGLWTDMVEMQQGLPTSKYVGPPGFIAPKEEKT